MQLGEVWKREVTVPVGSVNLTGELTLPARTGGVVVFAHGSGSSRFSPRNQFVARVLQQAGVGTMLFDLLTAEEEAAEYYTRHLRFDIPLLADRLSQVLDWLQRQPETHRMSYGLFGSSTGAAAALIAAESNHEVTAVVSRGGRADLAEAALEHVTAATLLIVGENDQAVLELNRAALARLNGEKQLVTIPRATHLFEEPGALEQVASLAAVWFKEHLQPVPNSA